MDEAFNQHSRRKPRPSLAPLTSKMPLDDVDLEDSADHPASRTYLEGKSAPTTPRLLSRTSTRTRLSSTDLPKSKSATHLAHPPPRRTDRGAASGTATPRRQRPEHGDVADGDWFLRTGALMSSEAREYKGQAWLVSRASSTSLAAGRDQESDDEDVLDRELEREREFASRRSSRRGSAANLAAYGQQSPVTGPRSRAHSRPGSRGLAMEPVDSEARFAKSPDSYDGIPGPDFVNLDERLEALEMETAAVDDEAAVRKLVRRGQSGQDSWLANVLGWSLFSVEEGDDESESEVEGDDVDGRGLGASSRCSSARYLHRLGSPPEERMPPPAEGGVWRDAAWLLTVASKVIL